MRALCFVALLALWGMSSAGAGSRSFSISGEVVQPLSGWVDFCGRMPQECLPAQGSMPWEMTPQAWEDLLAINFQVNKVWPKTDIEHYGTLDYWTYPMDGFGDCEDVALLKRSLLLRHGWPSSRLLLTIVRDRRNEGHAVLMVRSDQGDYILDSLTNEVLRWDNTSFVAYVMRQSERSPTSWVALRQDDATAVAALPRQ